MTADTDTDLAALVTLQLGRPPRTPWRVGVTCSYGYPQVVASPSRLDDGTLFPTLYWLTCPFLAEAASAAESSGRLAEWDSRVATDPALAEELSAADADLRSRRAEESGGHDACARVGVAGQSSPTAPKCLHARVALALAGVADPIGRALLTETGRDCPDRRCDSLVPKGHS